MADTKVSALTTLASPSSDDLLYVIDDPSGSPLSRKATIASVVAAATSQMVLIHDETLGVAGNFDVSSIPGTYDDLLIFVEARVDAAVTVQEIKMYLNNDTTETNYRNQAHGVYNGASESITTAANSIMAKLPGASSPANSWGQIRSRIGYYTSTSMLKTWKCTSYFLADTNHAELWDYASCWTGGGTVAVTRVTIQPDTYPTIKFDAGSRIRIIGVLYP